MALVSDVMKYFTDHPGTTVYLEEIVDHVHGDTRKVRNAVNNARNKYGDFSDRLEVVVRGNAWRYGSAPSRPGRRVFEEIGVTKTGQIVLECEDGRLYRAEEL